MDISPNALTYHDNITSLVLLLVGKCKKSFSSISARARRPLCRCLTAIQIFATTLLLITNRGLAFCEIVLFWAFVWASSFSVIFDFVLFQRLYKFLHLTGTNLFYLLRYWWYQMKVLYLLLSVNKIQFWTFLQPIVCVIIWEKFSTFCSNPRGFRIALLI